MEKRSKSNIAILSFYILLELIIPAIVLLYALTVDVVDISASWLVKPSRILFFLVSLPIYVVYLGLLQKTFFPTENKKALLFFPGYVINLLIYSFLHQSSQNLILFFVMYNLPLYIALNLCFMIGLVVLIMKKTSEDGFYQVSGKVFSTLIIMMLCFIPVIYFIIFGYQLNLYLSAANAGFNMFVLTYIVTILGLMHHYSRQLRKLYKKDLL